MNDLDAAGMTHTCTAAMEMTHGPSRLMKPRLSTRPYMAELAIMTVPIMEMRPPPSGSKGAQRRQAIPLLMALEM